MAHKRRQSNRLKFLAQSSIFSRYTDGRRSLPDGLVRIGACGHWNETGADPPWLTHACGTCAYALDCHRYLTGRYANQAVRN